MQLMLGIKFQMLFVTWQLLNTRESSKSIEYPYFDLLHRRATSLGRTIEIYLVRLNKKANYCKCIVGLNMGS